MNAAQGVGSESANSLKLNCSMACTFSCTFPRTRPSSQPSTAFAKRSYVACNVRNFSFDTRRGRRKS